MEIRHYFLMDVPFDFTLEPYRKFKNPIYEIYYKGIKRVLMYRNSYFFSLDTQLVDRKLSKIQIPV